MATELLRLNYTPDTIAEAAITFWKTLKQYHVLAFSGDMGAGKTTFIHNICDHLHVEDVVSSPTFALINEYHFTDDTAADRTIYHLDWYRLRDTPEAINAGMEDCIHEAQLGNAYCFIEWPEKAQDLLSMTHVYATIESLSDTERQMTVTLVS